MTELKAHNINDLSLHDIANCDFYLKPEADKYINLLKDKANYNEFAYKHKSEELADTCRFYEEELRHHKYKRCRAMVRCCMADNHTLSQVTLNEITNHLQWLFNVNFFVKWAARWSKIAEQFKDKEAK